MNPLPALPVLQLIETLNAVMREVNRIAADLEALDPYFEGLPFPVVEQLVDMHKAVAAAREVAES